MKGSILTYDKVSGKGIITGDDSNRYAFEDNDMLPTDKVVTLTSGMSVDFVANGLLANDVAVVVARIQERQKIVAILLALFAGTIGAHRFYTGKYGTGVAMLLLTLTFYGIIVSGVWAIYDLITICMGSYTDADGNSLI